MFFPLSCSAGLMPIEARGNYLPKPPYLCETKTYHSQPLESIRHDGNISSRYQYGRFLFFCCRNYVKLLDYWRAEKNFSTSGGPLWPEARSICHIATWLIRHCLHGLWDLYALCRSSKKRSVPGTKKWRTACTTKLILFTAVIRLYLRDAATASSALFLPSHLCHFGLCCFVVPLSVCHIFLAYLLKA